LSKKWKFVVTRNSQNEETPLMFAARRNCLPLVNTLLAAGVDPLLQNSVGQTADKLATDNAVKRVIVKAKLKRKGENKVEQMSLEALQAATKSVRQRDEKEKNRQELQVSKENLLRQQALQTAITSSLEREKIENNRTDRDLRIKEQETKQTEKRAAQAEREKIEESDRIEKELRIKEQEDKQAEKRAVQAEREKIEENDRIEKELRIKKQEAKQVEKRAAEERDKKEVVKRKKAVKEKTTPVQSVVKKMWSFAKKLFTRIKKTVLSSLGRLQSWLW